MDVTQELARRRRSWRLWLATALLVALALFAIDTGTGGRISLVGFFAIPPFIVAAAAGRRETAASVVVCFGLAIVVGIVDGFFGSFQHMFRVVLVGLAGLLAVRVAEVRARAELVGRLDRDVGRALAESRELREATPRLLETVARELRWDAAALWEVGRDGRLTRVQSWQAPGSRLDGFQRSGADISFEAGVGLPGRVLASGEAAWVENVQEDPGFRRSAGAAAAGIRGAAAFPVTGTRGVRGVIELFSHRPRRVDPALMQAMTSVGHYVGQHIERRRAEEAVRRGEAVRGAVLESALDSVITMNHEGRIVEFNPAAERTFGYRRSDAVGKLVRELIVPPHLRDRHQRGLERYLATGEGPLIGARAEVTAMKSDGTEFPIEISVARIGQDDPPMFAAYMRDITARKAAEESVRRLAAIVEHSNDAIVATDLRGTIVAWNPAAERLYGWRADEIIGRHISATAPVDRRSETNFLSRQVAEGNAISGHRTVRMRRDGSLVDVSLTISPILDADEKPIGMAGIVRDITEEKRIEGERIRLLDQEKVARLRAEELEQRASFLAEAQVALDSSLNFDEVLRRLTRLIVPMLADWCAVHMLEPDGSIRLVAVGHSDPERERFAWELQERYPADMNNPQGAIPGVLHTGEPLHIREVTEEVLEAIARNAEHREMLEGLGLRSVMIMPLRARSQTLGAISFGSAESQRLYGNEDVAFASELTRRAALSVDNARLHSELSSRSKELEFLADASAQLDATLDLEETLQRVADLTLQDPLLADGCMVDILEETGTVRRVATATLKPEVQPILDHMREQRIDLDSAHPIALAMRTGQLQRLDHIDEGERRSWTDDADYLEAVRRWPGRAALVAPMRARGRMLGAIAIASFSDRHFDDDDVRVLRELARRAAFAVDNARLYSETNYIAERLQRSLLPPHLPEIHGVEIAARFRPAGDRNEVGGDFYDIFQTGARRWAITIGDVCGKGPDAAAVTALARHTLRASAIRSDDPPDELLRALNDAMLVDNPSDFQFCTVAFASLEVGDACTRLSVSSGGHPLPVVLRAGGQMESVGEPGTLLGVVPDPVLTCAQIELFRGDTLVFYTDGITEARTRNGLFGYAGLLKAMRTCTGCDAAEIAERIEQTMLDVQIGGLRDDVALVVVQISAGTGASAREQPAVTAVTS